MSHANRRILRSVIEHTLIFLVILMGTSMVTMASNLEKDRPGISFYERVMFFFPCARP
jgi:hypothetical protein